MRFTARDLLQQKGRTGYLAVSADDTVLQALRVMAEARIGAVLVRDGERIVGIYTERERVEGFRDGEGGQGTSPFFPLPA